MIDIIGKLNIQMRKIIRHQPVFFRRNKTICIDTINTEVEISNKKITDNEYFSIGCCTTGLEDSYCKDSSLYEVIKNWDKQFDE